MDLISAYANGVSELTHFSQSLETSPLIVDVIVNPHAGFFKSKTSLKKMIRELQAKLADLASRFPRRSIEIKTVHFTEYPGHARKITEEILDSEEKGRTGIERLLIGCGGDGTSNEICTALVSAPRAVLDRLKLLRLPLGTGNDVADTRSFSEAYELILGSLQAAKSGALVVTFGAGAEPRYAFNIGSVGLDAYIADLTNRFKRLIPGQAYKALVDIGSLFYEQSVKPLPMDVRLHTRDGIISITGIVPSMIVVGISGGRTYGGHMAVLPGRENVCVVDGMGLLSKIRNKKLFYEGRHGILPEVRFYTASQVDIEYAGRIPLQLDGELAWLEKKDFPLTLRVMDPAINVLRS
jgi:diacylglycerol kinase family enzyme